MVFVASARMVPNCVVPNGMRTYNSRMVHAIQADPSASDIWRENAFDLVRGLAAYTASPLASALAEVIARHPSAAIADAFNHKQVASKLWARNELFKAAGGAFGRVWVLGGWYGVLAAMLFDDARFKIGAVASIDIDPEVGPVARTLNAFAGSRFEAVTGDMYALDYAAARPDLVVNTSCEHIADIRRWLALLPMGTRVLLQSNDYFSEPSHINCMSSLAEFRETAGISELRFAGELPLPKYTRFMLIGAV